MIRTVSFVMQPMRTSIKSGWCMHMRTWPSRWAAAGKGLEREQRACPAVSARGAHAGVIDGRQTERAAVAQHAVADRLHVIALHPCATHASVTTLRRAARVRDLTLGADEVCGTPDETQNMEQLAYYY